MKITSDLLTSLSEFPPILLARNPSPHPPLPFLLLLLNVEGFLIPFAISSCYKRMLCEILSRSFFRYFSASFVEMFCYLFQEILIFLYFQNNNNMASHFCFLLHRFIFIPLFFFFVAFKGSDLFVIDLGLIHKIICSNSQIGLHMYN